MAKKRNSNANKPNNRLLKRLYQKTITDDTIGSDNDSVLNDTLSVASTFSNISQRYDSDDGMSAERNSPDYIEDEDNFCHEESYDKKISMILDAMQSSKSQKDRIYFYEKLAKIFINHFCGDGDIEMNKMTLQDIIEHGMKRSNDEAAFSALILSLTLITMGESAVVIYQNEFLNEIHNQLERIILDANNKPSVRSKCVTALSLICFITDYTQEQIKNVMNILLSISFSSSRVEQDAAINSLKANCLDMFSFLAIMIHNDIMDPQKNKLIKCLDSSNLELRISAGECIALLYEKYCLEEENPNPYNDQEICQRLCQLVNDSQKSRSKKDLRIQRSKFRQILRTIEGDSFDPETIKFGSEKLILYSWKMKRYYNTFCGILGSGMNLHLTQNQYIRDIFGLCEVMSEPIGSSKSNKVKEKHQNNANRKTREMNRSKMRGKRSDFDF